MTISHSPTFSPTSTTSNHWDEHPALKTATTVHSHSLLLSPPVGRMLLQVVQRPPRAWVRSSTHTLIHKKSFLCRLQCSPSDPLPFCPQAISLFQGAMVELVLLSHLKTKRSWATSLLQSLFCWDRKRNHPGTALQGLNSKLRPSDKALFLSCYNVFIPYCTSPSSLSLPTTPHPVISLTVLCQTPFLIESSPPHAHLAAPSSPFPCKLFHSPLLPDSSVLAGLLRSTWCSKL